MYVSPSVMSKWSFALSPEQVKVALEPHPAEVENFTSGQYEVIVSVTFKWMLTA